MAVLSVARTRRITVPAGDEDVVLIVRHPTAQEMAKLSTGKLHARGGKLQNDAFEARVNFLRPLLVNVENAAVELSDGSIAKLSAEMSLSADDCRHLSAILGVTVETWRDVVAPQWLASAAMTFEEVVAEQKN